MSTLELIIKTLVMIPENRHKDSYFSFITWLHYFIRLDVVEQEYVISSYRNDSICRIGLEDNKETILDKFNKMEGLIWE